MKFSTVSIAYVMNMQTLFTAEVVMLDFFIPIIYLGL